MKVRELIAKLEKLPSEAKAKVWVEGSGLDIAVDIDEVSQEGSDRVDLDVLVEPNLQLQCEPGTEQTPKTKKELREELEQIEREQLKLSKRTKVILKSYEDAPLP